MQLWRTGDQFSLRDCLERIDVKEESRRTIHEKRYRGVLKLLRTVCGSILILFYLVVLYSFIPESVRWLLKKGRVTEAREIISKVARLNGKQMPDENLYLSNDEQNERLGDFRDLFMSPRMIHKTLGSWLMW